VAEQSGAVAITGVGMVTGVGATGAQSCAAILAGLSRTADLPEFPVSTPELEEVPLQGVALRWLTTGYAGTGRFVRLASAALRDLLRTVPLSPEERAGTGMFLALPDARAAGDASLAERVGERLCDWCDFPAREIQVQAEGHAAGALALQAACDSLGAGARAAIVLGADSLIEPSRLDFLAPSGRLLAPGRSAGFLPGEGASALALETHANALAAGRRAWAILAGVGTAVESETIWKGGPGTGDALSEAVRAALQQDADAAQQVSLVVSDLNGEVYRAREFAGAVTRILAGQAAPWVLRHSADCIGDVGAAGFVVSAGLGAHALERGYAGGASVLITGSSDEGLRGAALLRAAA
jgi:3-oxoacyl-[acyl-carrier-protein] synthase-1